MLLMKPAPPQKNNKIEKREKKHPAHGSQEM